MVSGASTAGEWAAPGMQILSAPQPLGHHVLDVGWPRVVVLAVADQLGQPIERRELRSPVGTVEQVLGHLGQAERAAQRRSVGKEVDDLRRRALRLRLRLELAVPHLADEGAEQFDVGAGGLEEVEQVAQYLSPVAADRAWP